MTPIYVVSLPQATDRRNRLKKRLAHHNLLDQTTFIDAIYKTSPLIDWINCGAHQVERRGEWGCFLSHLKALRTLVASHHEAAIILEDDAMLHNEFPKKWAEILQEKPADIELIMLCSFNMDPSKARQVTPHLWTIHSLSMGAQGYWLTKNYAARCLEMFDRSPVYIPHPWATSELITIFSRGLFAEPPLVIEEASNSFLQLNYSLQYHRNYFSRYGYENYDPSLQKPSWVDAKEASSGPQDETPYPPLVRADGHGIYVVPTSVSEDVKTWFLDRFAVRPEDTVDAVLRHLMAWKQAAADLAKNDTGQGAIIIEPALIWDPVKVKTAVEGRPKNLDVLLLSHCCGNWGDVKFVEGTDQYCTVPPSVQGHYGYWVSRHQLERVLSLYDRPLRSWPVLGVHLNLLTRPTRCAMVYRPVIGDPQNASYFGYYGLL